MIVVDTNVVSELMRPTPADAVVGWIRARRAGELFTTAITVAEIRYGIERLPGGRRQDLLRTTADGAFAAFDDQVLSFDGAAALHYASVVTRRDDAGLPIDEFDAQIAAICQANGARLATRHRRDFVGTGIDVVDPWERD